MHARMKQEFSPKGLRRARPTHAGFSLLEVMVAVLVLSVGLLSLGALQLSTKRANFEATQRAIAVGLAQAIIERMRANAGQLGAYTNAGAGLTMTGTVVDPKDCSAGCDESQIAQLDLIEWRRSLAGVAEQSAGASAGGLTLSTACITGPNGGSGEYTVAIAWRGLTRLSNPAVNACGEGSGLYDHEGGAEADVYRRLLVIQTYIAQPL
jgi:type IV pilus assembly protein PilV